MCILCATHKSYLMSENMSGSVASALNTGSTVSAAFTSSSSSVNALLEGISWSGTTGQAATVAYTYSASTMGGTLFNATERTAAEAVLQQWENVANINFTPASTAGTAKLTFSKTNLGTDVSGLTTSQFVGTTTTQAEVQGDNTVTNYTSGGFGFFMLLHEVGHALGLKHPGNYGGDEGPFLPASEDTYNASVMSYNPGSFANDANYPITPMIYDIAAAQYLYGANTSYNADDTTYTLTGAKTAMTIWDGGGIDTLNASSLTSAVTLDLKESLNTVSTVGQGYYWMAIGANIENATGGSGNDFIYGNGLNNTLLGGGGNDFIRGGRNDDVINGNQGVDNLFGDLGNDMLFGGQGNDVMYGGQNDDSLSANIGDDTVSGDRGNDTLFGGQGNDVLYGLADNDVIWGDRGNDTIDGGSGNDTFVFSTLNGTDVIVGFENAGALAGDLIQVLANVNSSGITDVGVLLSRITYSGAGAVIDLGAGNTVTLQGITAGLDASDFALI